MSDSDRSVFTLLAFCAGALLAFSLDNHLIGASLAVTLIIIINLADRICCALKR